MCPGRSAPGPPAAGCSPPRPFPKPGLRPGPRSPWQRAEAARLLASPPRPAASICGSAAWRGSALAFGVRGRGPWQRAGGLLPTPPLPETGAPSQTPDSGGEATGNGRVRLAVSVCGFAAWRGSALAFGVRGRGPWQRAGGLLPTPPFPETGAPSQTPDSGGEATGNGRVRLAVSVCGSAARQGSAPAPWRLGARPPAMGMGGRAASRPVRACPRPRGPGAEPLVSGRGGEGKDSPHTPPAAPRGRPARARLRAPRRTVSAARLSAPRGRRAGRVTSRPAERAVAARTAGCPGPRGAGSAAGGRP